MCIKLKFKIKAFSFTLTKMIWHMRVPDLHSDLIHLENHAQGLEDAK